MDIQASGYFQSCDDTRTGEACSCAGAASRGTRLPSESNSISRAAETISSIDRKSTRLNSSHLVMSYAVFCLKKKKKKNNTTGNPCVDRAQTPRSSNSASSLALGHHLARPVLKCLCLFFFFFFFFFFNDTATTEIYTLSLHDALPI